MKRIRFATVVLAIVALLAGAIYIIAARRASDAKSVKAVARTTEDKSIAFHEGRVAAQPDDAEAHRMLAAAYTKRAEATGNGADYDHAALELDRADQLDPGSLRLIQARALLLMSRHRFGQARQVAEMGLQKQADNADLLGIAGDGALESGDLDAAGNYYQKLTEAAPKLPSSWARMSHLFEVKGDLAQAIKLMEKSMEASYPKPLAPTTFAWSRTIIGEMEAKRGHLDEARRQYDWALYKSPDHPLTLEFMADLDQWQGKPDEAEAIYRKLLARREDPKFQLSLAALLERRGEKDEAATLRAAARDFYERAVAGGNEGYLRALATLELSAGHYARAAELADRDLALRPTTESRAIYANILKAANDAGQSLTVAKNF